MNSSQKNMSPHPVEIHFFHGFLGNPSDWDPIRSLLPGFHCVAHDICSEPEITLPSLLIGYSMGGRAVLDTYFRSPKNIRGIILLSTQLGLSSLEERAVRHEEEMRWLNRISLYGIPQFIKWWYTLPLFQEFVQTPQFVSTFPLRLQNSFITIQEQLTRYSISRNENFWEKVSEISIPIYFLFGERDTKYEPVFTRCCALPKEKIPACGHVLHLEAPQACAKQIKQFIEVNYDSLARSETIY